MNVVVIGATGAIGAAMIKQLVELPNLGQLFSFSRCHPCLNSASPICQLNSAKVVHGFVDLESETSIQQLGEVLSDTPLDLVLICTGLLHNTDIKPEKSLKNLDADKLQRLFQINSIAPALIAQQLMPRLRRRGKAVFAALSARVSSISDNRLGGWYGYRASKSALNMFLKTAAIEVSRTHPEAVVVGLHPGTVDSNLSAPFQRGVPAHQLFSADQAANYLLQVIGGLGSGDSGKLFAWDGEEIPF